MPTVLPISPGIIAVDRRVCMFGLVWNQQLWEGLPPTESDTTTTGVVTWGYLQGDGETLLGNACCSRLCAEE